MSKNRIIASLLFSENDAFHSQNFLPNKYLGEVSNIIRIWSLQSIDEILIISASDRAIDDLFLEKLKINLRHAFVPISYIGSINSADDASRLIQSGIEKIGIPISKIDESWVPNFTNKYGKQALFTSIDITDSNFNKLIKLIPKASKVSGEIVINNHERNGTFLGINMKIVDSPIDYLDEPIKEVVPKWRKTYYTFRHNTPIKEPMVDVDKLIVLMENYNWTLNQEFKINNPHDWTNLTRRIEFIKIC